MSDNYLGSLGGVKPDITTNTVQAAQAAQAVQQVQSVQANQVQQSAQSKPANLKSQNSEKTNNPSKALEQMAKEKEETAELNDNRDKNAMLTNTALRFKVDNETNEVTLLIVDKASEKVIRTIPPEAIKKVPPGDLFQFSM